MKGFFLSSKNKNPFLIFRMVPLFLLLVQVFPFTLSIFVLLLVYVCQPFYRLASGCQALWVKSLRCVIAPNLKHSYRFIKMLFSLHPCIFIAFDILCNYPWLLGVSFLRRVYYCKSFVHYVEMVAIKSAHLLALFLCMYASHFTGWL